MLKIFAGAIHQGLLSFTIDGVTIDFANPPGDLKAQRVSFRKSETDPTLYTCEVKFPKVKTKGDVTTFGVIVAARVGQQCRPLQRPGTARQLEDERASQVIVR